MFITLNGNVYQIAITDASQLHPQAKVIDWIPEDAQGICFFFSSGCVGRRLLGTSRDCSSISLDKLGS